MQFRGCKTLHQVGELSSGHFFISRHMRTIEVVLPLLREMCNFQAMAEKPSAPLLQQLHQVRSADCEPSLSADRFVNGETEVRSSYPARPGRHTRVQNRSQQAWRLAASPADLACDKFCHKDAFEQVQFRLLEIRRPPSKYVSTLRQKCLPLPRVN